MVSNGPGLYSKVHPRSALNFGSILKRGDELLIVESQIFTVASLKYMPVPCVVVRLSLPPCLKAKPTSQKLKNCLYELSLKSTLLTKVCFSKPALETSFVI